MGEVRDFAEKLLSGETNTEEQHPFTAVFGLEKYGEAVGFVSCFANVTSFLTDAGLVLFDASGPLGGDIARSSIRGWTQEPFHTLVYTHGHLDHVGGVDAFENDAKAKSATLRVVSHEAVPARFARYALTQGYNGRINARQFRLGSFMFPSEYRHPDAVYRDALDLDIGGTRFELHHAKGETDDHTWAYVPQHKAVCTGDLFIWASPNCGNPQKVQRFPMEWARALRAMAAKNAELLFPGHGPPIDGAERVRDALSSSAELLETLHDQTVERMNSGMTLDRILAEVKAPEHLLAKPWLRPVYDEPEFIVRNVYRLYGGWWDGNPARLKPARDAAIAREVAELTGGAAKLIERAAALVGSDIALACQLAEWASAAAPDDEGIARARGAIYRARAEKERSLMSIGIFSTAAEEGDKQ